MFCLLAQVREHFVSPFKHCRTLGDDGPKHRGQQLAAGVFARAVFSFCLSGISLLRKPMRTGQNHNRSPIVGRKPSNEEILARARRVIISAKARGLQPKGKGFNSIQVFLCFISSPSGFQLQLVLRPLEAHREMSWDKVFAAADSDKRLA